MRPAALEKQFFRLQRLADRRLITQAALTDGYFLMSSISALTRRTRLSISGKVRAAVFTPVPLSDSARSAAVRSALKSLNAGQRAASSFRNDFRSFACSACRGGEESITGVRQFALM